MTGSLQIKNGKYYAVLNYKDNKGKRKQKWLCTELDAKGNKRKAEQFLHNAITEYEDMNEIKPDILFCEYIMKWVEDMKNHVEITTFEGYYNNIKKHIYPYFYKKKIKLTELTAKDISTYYSYKLNTLCPNTVKRLHANIRKCLQKAFIEDIIPSNPADKVQLPKVTRYNAKYYDSEQVKILLEKSKGTDIEPIVILCVYYGLRRSEALGLKWQSVDFKNGTIKICNTITRGYTLCEKERTKTLSSNRTLPLIPAVCEYLKKLKEEQKQYKKMFGNCYIDNDYVCAKPDGTLIRPEDVSHKFTKLLKENNLPHIRLHDLRHSCASMLIAQGVDIKVIQEWLGHSSIATTGNIYGHLQFKQKIATGELLENLLSG